MFKDYFLELKKADYLEACLLYCYVHSMREHAIRAFARAKFTTTADFLKHFLAFDSENSTLTYLEYLGYEFGGDREKIKNGEMPLKLEAKGSAIA